MVLFQKLDCIGGDDKYTCGTWPTVSFEAAAELFQSWFVATHIIAATVWWNSNNPARQSLWCQPASLWYFKCLWCIHWLWCNRTDRGENDIHWKTRTEEKKDVCCFLITLSGGTTCMILWRCWNMNCSFYDIFSHNCKKYNLKIFNDILYICCI